MHSESIETRNMYKRHKTGFTDHSTNNPRHAVHRSGVLLVPPLGLRSRRNGRRSKKILTDGPGAAGFDPSLRSQRGVAVDRRSRPREAALLCLEDAELR